MKRLAPDIKTIADFRKDNSDAVHGACRTIIQFLAANQDSVVRRTQVTEQRQCIDHVFYRYLKQLDQADHDDQPIELDTTSITKALKQLQQGKTALN
jgi:hypothetical protein